MGSGLIVRPFCLTNGAVLSCIIQGGGLEKLGSRYQRLCFQIQVSNHLISWSHVLRECVCVCVHTVYLFL